MKFSVSWLSDYIELNVSLDVLVEKLTALGLEVEEVSNPAAELGAFHIAHVIEAVQHPNADKLRVCKVDTGDEIVTVVCGAPNARTGLKGVFAPSGTYVPGVDFTLKPTDIRGVTSNGMLCSERELLMSDEHDGIIDLPEDAPVGMKFVDYAKLDDPVIEIAITPNRQDCLGIYGIARDLSAAGLGTLKPNAIEAQKGSFKSPVNVTIDKGSLDACPVFFGRMIKGVKNGPSPKWLQKKLTDVGLRPISALVDITNYMTVAQCRPLHVYDAAKLKGDIAVRMANKGEEFAALDDNTYTALGDECAISDDSGIIGFGGIMGGETTSCSEDTTDVFLEAALFDPISTAMTGRKHQILSDARFRFERGVDSNFTRPGIEMATKLITEICGGEVSELIKAGEVPTWEKQVEFRVERIKTLGGLELSTDICRTILTNLGFTMSDKPKGDVFTIDVPSWRTDIVGEADIVEEVLRVHGYDEIPSVYLDRTEAVARPTLTTGQQRSKAARRQLASDGLMECITWSFISEKAAGLFGWSNNTIKVDNPISADLCVMRPSILPNLIMAAGTNADRGQKAIGLFEVGPEYADDTPKGQSLVAAGIRAGVKHTKHWIEGANAVDVFDAKKDAIAALEAAGAPAGNLQVFTESAPWYHPGRSGTLRLGAKNILAAFGEIHPQILRELDVKGPVVGFEVYLDKIPASRKKGGKTRVAMDASNLQAVERDFAFLVKKDVPSAKLLNAVKGADKKFIKNVTIFDVFEGKGMDEDEKSLALTVRLEPIDKTFTDKDIEAISNAIIAAATKAVSAKLRS